MEKMTYNDRVKMIAEEMARDEDKRLVGYDRWHEQAYKSYFKTMTSGHHHNARIAVAKMAEAYEEGYMSNFPDTGLANEKMWRDNCHEEMIEYGLIPDRPE